MKIDYDLVEKIGAANYNPYQNTFVRMFDGKVQFYSNYICKWVDTAWDSFDAIKPIPPKPQVRVEYEKVVELDGLVKNLEDGKLFYQSAKDAGKFVAYDNESQLLRGLCGKNVYRRIEKPVDWRFELEQLMKSESKLGFEDELPANYTVAFNNHVYYIVESEFIEMCHLVAEITERPNK